MFATYKGIIRAVDYKVESGIAIALIDEHRVYLDVQRGVAGFVIAFGENGNFLENCLGREIVFIVDGLGFLMYFMPVEYWDGPVVPPGGTFRTEFIPRRVTRN
ncbi:MAG: hypothetical protein P9M00_08765 [Candidatus Tritonobacter lacicola]|nr:hypothetical protein [Candidatus Tritonobacter lacicola]